MRLTASEPFRESAASQVNLARELETSSPSREKLAVLKQIPPLSKNSKHSNRKSQARLKEANAKD